MTHFENNYLCFLARKCVAFFSRSTTFVQQTFDHISWYSNPWLLFYWGIALQLRHHWLVIQACNASEELGRACINSYAYGTIGNQREALMQSGCHSPSGQDEGGCNMHRVYIQRMKCHCAFAFLPNVKALLFNWTNETLMFGGRWRLPNQTFFEEYKYIYIYISVDSDL